MEDWSLEHNSKDAPCISIGWKRPGCREWLCPVLSELEPLDDWPPESHPALWLHFLKKPVCHVFVFRPQLSGFSFKYLAS